MYPHTRTHTHAHRSTVGEAALGDAGPDRVEPPDQEDVHGKPGRRRRLLSAVLGQRGQLLAGANR